MDGEAGDGTRAELISRRRLLRLLALTAGTGALAAPAGLFGATGSARARPPVRPAATGAVLARTPPRSGPRTPGVTQPASTVPAPGPVRPRTVSTRHADEPDWLRRWDEPVSSLHDFVARDRDARFPRHAIMLTIDDGPDPEWTPKYLRLLARHHVQATFNVIGEQVREYPKLVRATVGEGHHVANHTFHHPEDLPYLSARRIRHELEDTTDAIVRASGFRPRQFRAPGGVWGPDVYAEAARQQMLPLGWDIDPRDWALPGVAAIRDAMLAARPHDIILCHDGGGDRSETYAALQTVIPALLARGWQFVVLPTPQAL